MKLIITIISHIEIDRRKLKRKRQLLKSGSTAQTSLTIVNQRKYEASVLEWEKAIKGNPNNEILWNNKGVSLVRLGAIQDAIKCYNKALKINPRFENAWFNKGKAFTKIEHHKDAIKCYDHVLELNPKNVSAWNNRGIALRTLGKFDEALGCFDKTIEINNNYEWGWHNKGFTLSEIGKLEDAVECYNRALEINPNYQSALRNKQRCLHILELQRKEVEFSKPAGERGKMTTGHQGPVRTRVTKKLRKRFRKRDNTE